MFVVRDKKVRERLLQETELTLAGAMTICQASEPDGMQNRSVNILRTRTAQRRLWLQWQDQCRNREDYKLSDKETQRHLAVKDVATNMRLNNVQHMAKYVTNHFAKQCFSKGKQSRGESVHTAEETELSDSFFIGMVVQADLKQKETEQCSNINCVEQDKWIMPLQINGAAIPLKLDTRAKANLMGERDIRAMKVKPHIHPGSVKLRAYNGQNINTRGTCRLKVKLKEKEHHLMFAVVPDGHDSLLGDTSCETLALVKRVYYTNNVNTQDCVQSIVNQYSDIFKGIWCLTVHL